MASDLTDSTITQRFELIEARILAACRRAGRDRSEVQLVGASKRQPIPSLQEAFRAGLEVFGENRVQEARDKREHLPSGASWHLLGPLQSNKVSLATPLFDTFHAIDRPKIARRLNRETQRLGLARRGFLEVNLGDEPTKHGFSVGEVLPSLSTLRSELGSLRIVGLMAIPPRETSEVAIRGWFQRLRELRDEARQLNQGFEGLLSMGMSGDFEIAIEEGATHIRVGTLLFGERPPVAR